MSCIATVRYIFLWWAGIKKLDLCSEMTTGRIWNTHAYYWKWTSLDFISQVHQPRASLCRALTDRTCKSVPEASGRNKTFIFDELGMRADCCTAVGQMKPRQQNVKQHHLVFVSSAGNRHGPVSTCRFSSAACRLSSDSGVSLHPILSLPLESVNRCQHHISPPAMSVGWDKEDPHTTH